MAIDKIYVAYFSEVQSKISLIADAVRKTKSNLNLNPLFAESLDFSRRFSQRLNLLSSLNFYHLDFSEFVVQRSIRQRVSQNKIFKL